MRAPFLALLLFAAGPAIAETPATPPLCTERGLVDLWPVSSRYIGETEKALEMRFEDASAIARSSLLAFDEADALFGRPRDGNDERYANQEVSYLLVHRGPPRRVGGFGARALAAGYARDDPKRGVIVVERGERVLTVETRGMRRSEALRFARRFVSICG